ncbi:tRNA(Ser) Um(44) 2'-O-methyltransferase [Thecaphora frezii]
MHTWGLMHSYIKRVQHNILVPREAYQDHYLALKERYTGHPIVMWSERPDPKKHVFEDLGIAAFLILLWCRWWGDKMRGAPAMDSWCGF